ncbi:NADPH-dependent FMN reductase [Candidatus Paracaedibacter symbiosus]|uniref:NADPH-dependent FMN reductase n=1 Tax=Candidatus Paracaedibacter symbiosus TaxID=244582 RepID=UPI000509D4AD|nr:NADPH-dependent FMN reductase [Candidatus Paracaedibacter symbiosus]
MLKKIISYLTLLIGFCLSTVNAEPITAIVLQTSLNKTDSRSDLIGEILYDKATKAGFKVEKISLKDFPLPLCDGHGGAAFDDPNVKILHAKIKEAKAIFVAFPVYNYAVSAGTKNLFELTSHPHKDILSGDAWGGKVVALIGSAGSPKSMLAPLSFADSIMTDQKCHIVPHITIANADDFKDKKPTKELDERLNKIVEQAKQLATMH